MESIPAVRTSIADCPFLQNLPVELRLRIYEHLLNFNNPIKLRQIIPGSRDLSFLRVCRQILNEAVPVLYDLNTIIVTRNDFCRYTDDALKTPLKLNYARHLRVVAFSQSIACTLVDPTWQCDVCQPSAMGLIKAFMAMPRLRSVVVDYRQHRSEMHAFVEQFGAELEKENLLRLRLRLLRFEPMTFLLEGSAVRDLDVQFRCGS